MENKERLLSILNRFIYELKNSCRWWW
jgi:hypothetical protein